MYKAVKRIEGIFYAIKISREKINRRSVAKMRQLNREICALSFLGKCNENLIRYYSSWIEERVYFTVVENFFLTPFKAYLSKPGS